MGSTGKYLKFGYFRQPPSIYAHAHSGFLLMKYDLICKYLYILPILTVLLTGGS